MVLTSRAGPTASGHNGVRSPDDLSHGLPWSMGEERRRDLMASAFPVGSSAAIDFTAGEMTLLRALIAGPPTLNRHPLSREFCRGIGWFKPDSGLKDMMARVAHSLMWLPVLQLRHGRRSGDAAPELSAVEGSDPPLGMPRSGKRLALGVYVFFAGSTMIRPRPRLTT